MTRLSTGPSPHAGIGAADTPTLYFVGVTTSKSSIMTLFPEWAKLLELDARIAGIDIALGAAPSAYRKCVEAIAADPAARGALVTTHKAAVFDEAGDLFAELDPYAKLCREVSCVVTRGGEIHGLAKDPITAGLAMDHMLGPDYWSHPGRHAVCFGAGGAGLAIAVRLLSAEQRPERLVLVDRDPRRIELARLVVEELDADTEVELRSHVDLSLNDELVAASPRGSLFINATGLGKDRPGSPLSGQVRFPQHSAVWDLNYRGDLVYLDIARAQAAAKNLHVQDGWRYFLHGWTEVIAEVFALPMTQKRFATLAQAAERLSGRAGSPVPDRRVTDA
ncbi:shikimate dehydrogenase [Streptomyces sp. NPDC093250]|uniref:shikimate dehydrogenase n=1 Tax=Streptomyces sp. NPDC093250 TaxID=3366036 RepID=UPI00381FF3BC